MDDEWFTEGFVIGARAERGRTIHAGVVHPLTDTDGRKLNGYTMSPLCLGYRKRDGQRLAAHERGQYPMLVGRLRHAFAEYADGRQPHGLPLCPYCIAVHRRAAVPDPTEETP